MEKQEIGTSVFPPMPVVIVGTRVNGKENFMTVGTCSRVNGDPPWIAFAANKKWFSPKGIRETGTFSVNLPSARLVEKTDYCGMVSGADADKSKVFGIFYGRLETAPMIRECPVALECRLVRDVDLPAYTLFIGEIAGAWADRDAVRDGNPDFPRIDPLILTMPDNRYWTLGKHAGDAWSAGKNLKP